MWTMGGDAFSENTAVIEDSLISPVLSLPPSFTRMDRFRQTESAFTWICCEGRGNKCAFLEIFVA